MITSSQFLVPTPDPEPTVHRQQHPFDFESPVDSFIERLKRIELPGQAVWFAPRVIVSCQLPTKEYWRAVYAEHGTWMKEARTHFGRRMVEFPGCWTDPLNPSAPQEHHLRHRRACLTGLLQIDDLVISLRHWPTRQQVGYKPKRRRRRSA